MDETETQAAPPRPKPRYKYEDCFEIKVRFERAEWERLQRMSASTLVSINDLMRTGVRRFLEASGF